MPSKNGAIYVMKRAPKSSVEFLLISGLICFLLEIQEDKYTCFTCLFGKKSEREQ